MSGDDVFLARWSRRKRLSVAQKSAGAKPPAAPAASEVVDPAIAASEASAELPSLPPIESLDAASDITPFLAPGVPAGLTRRALRQAWASDPAIRDFVGLSENSWDFNAPDGVPGFGSLTPEDVRRLIDGVTGQSEAADPAPEEPAVRDTKPPAAPVDNPMPADRGDGVAVTGNGAGSAVAATQPEPDRQKPVTPPRDRRHGSALPQ